MKQQQVGTQGNELCKTDEQLSRMDKGFPAD